jgi:ATP-dependent DNA ligase
MASRVMLADNKVVTDEQIQAHLDDVGFLWGQPKIDGMRVHINNDCLPQSRSGKIFRNKALQAWCKAHPSLRGLDGEVVAGHEYTEDSFRESMSGIRAENGSREFTFFMFDTTYYGWCEYIDRFRELRDVLHTFGEFQEGEEYHCKLVICHTEKLQTLEGVHEFEQWCIREGWEGAMLRM